MKKYFVNCHTTEELKKAYHQAVKETHPDLGGSAEAFKAVQAEYEAAAKRIAAEEAGKGSQKHADGTAKSAEEIFQEQEKFREVLSQIIHLDGLRIEICGNWLWVSGNTYEFKEQIKAAGMKFASKKKAWYWHAGEWVRKVRKHYSMDEIRDMHGSEVIKAGRVERLAAAM